MSGTIFAGDVVNQYAASIGTGGGLDLQWANFEEAYAFLRDQRFAWNTKVTNLLTFGQAGEPDTTTFTWTEGDDYIVPSAALTLDYNMTGRTVKLGDYWYRVVDYGYRNAGRVYVDRQIAGSLSVGTTLVFLRPMYSIQTSGVLAVRLAEQKAFQVPDEYTDNIFGLQWANIWNEGGETADKYAARMEEQTRLPAPAYGLTVTSSGVGSLAVGKYRYFVTRYDPQSGHESAPGPIVEYSNTDGKTPSLVYANPAANKSENTSYALRYYRTRVNPTVKRPAFYLVSERSPEVLAASGDTLPSIPRNVTRYYDGPMTEICIWPVPTGRIPLQVRHVNSWGRRPEDDDALPIGDDNSVLEVLRIHMQALRGPQDQPSQEFRNSIIQVRRQVAYLLGRSRNPAANDLSVSTFQPHTYPDDNGDASWIANVPVRW